MPIRPKFLGLSQRGYSLIEIIAAMFVISIGMPAVAFMYTTAIVSDNDSTARTQGIYIANSLMNEISVRRYKESVAFPGNGAETGETTVSSYTRAGFDDIDDYQYFAANGGWGRLSPPRTEDGTSLTDFSNYNQYVTVVNINPPDVNGVMSLTAVTQGTTDIKLATVEVQWMGGKQSVTVRKIFTIP